MTDRKLNARITQVVASAPEWVRTDLTSRDPIIRERAEETIAAMIAAALTEQSSEVA